MPPAAAVVVPVAGGQLPLTVVQPAGAVRTAVVVIQEAFGVTGHIVEVAERLAAAGHLAVVPHLFHRTGDPVLPYDDFSTVMPHLQELDAAGLAADLDATLAYLVAAEVEPSGTAVIGFCMGGTVALWTGVRRPLGLAVSFYGGGVTTGRFGLPPLVELAPSLQTPWLGLYGDLDQGIPIADVEELRTAARRAPVPVELVRYAEAGHGFHCDARPGSFNADAAADAWRRTLVALDTHVGPSAG